jgi:threonine aldolase
LGAPIGSLLLGSKNNILKATRIRKAMGGGMRQAGFIAAAGLYALKNNITRLSIDNERAKIIANVLQQKKFVESVYPTETNIVIFKVNQNQLNIEKLLHELNNNNIKAVSMGNNLIRFVLHLNISDSEFDFIVNKLNELN